MFWFSYKQGSIEAVRAGCMFIGSVSRAANYNSDCDYDNNEEKKKPKRESHCSKGGDKVNS